MKVVKRIERIIQDALAANNPEWFVSDGEMPFSDATREVIEPGTEVDNHVYKDGCVTIRTDGDFYMIASLPYEIRYYDFRTVLKVLFPNKEFSIQPDSGDPLTDELHNLSERNRDMRQAILDRATEWPMTILEVITSDDSTFMTEMRFINEFDGQEYTTSIWKHQVPVFVAPGLRTIGVGKIIDDTVMRFNYIDFKSRGSHTYYTAAGTKLNWKFGRREPIEDTADSA